MLVCNPMTSHPGNVRRTVRSRAAPGGTCRSLLDLEQSFGPSVPSVITFSFKPISSLHVFTFFSLSSTVTMETTCWSFLWMCCYRTGTSPASSNQTHGHTHLVHLDTQRACCLLFPFLFHPLLVFSPLSCFSDFTPLARSQRTETHLCCIRQGECVSAPNSCRAHACQRVMVLHMTL